MKSFLHYLKLLRIVMLGLLRSEFINPLRFISCYLIGVKYCLEISSGDLLYENMYFPLKIYNSSLFHYCDSDFHAFRITSLCKSFRLKKLTCKQETRIPEVVCYEYCTGKERKTQNKDLSHLLIQLVGAVAYIFCRVAWSRSSAWKYI